LINFRNTNTELYASEFSFYSINKLRCLDKQILYNLLGSQSFRFQIESYLLQSLIDLGLIYLEFWTYIEVWFSLKREFHFL
jgi:hypothetical protein